MPLVEQVAIQIKKLRGNRTFAELSRDTGMDDGYLSRIFQGKRNLTLETLERLANAFGQDVEVKFRQRRISKTP